MYNTHYRCVKPFTVFDDKTQSPVRIERGSIWQLNWCGGKYSFKELKTHKMTISLPDSYVERYFKKV